MKNNALETLRMICTAPITPDDWQRIKARLQGMITQEQTPAPSTTADNGRGLLEIRQYKAVYGESIGE